MLAAPPIPPVSGFRRLFLSWCLLALLACVTLFFALTAQAGRYETAKAKDEKAPAYALAYSADHRVCNHFLQLFNSDIAKYGYIDTTAHEEFNKILWTPLEWEAGKPPFSSQIVSLTLFDINNDGKHEYVVKSSAMLHGTHSDDLYVFKTKPTDVEDVIKKLRTEEKGASNFVITKLRKTGGFYNLKMLPPHTHISGPFKGQFYYDWIGGRFSIHPLRYKGVTYISVNERLGTNINLDVIDFTEWHVLAKYLADYELQDICYFKGPERQKQRR